MGGGVAPVNYTAGISQPILTPEYTTNISDVLARNEEAKKVTTKKYQSGEI
jgi:hypothetical protein